VLILDRDPDDPKWVLTTVVELADVRPAGPDAALDEVTARWVSGRVGLALALTPLRGALAWRVDEPGQ
jgi:hypothetical protein